MVKKRKVVGLKLITLKDGKEVGQVQDIILNPNKRKVEALIAQKGNVLEESKVVLLDAVQSIGEDAVIIESEEKVKPISDVQKPLPQIAEVSKHVTETPLVTVEGKELGNINDVYFDPSTGNVEELEMRQVSQKGGKSKKKRIIVSDVVTVGKDVTVVSGYGENIFPQASNEQSEEPVPEKNTIPVGEPGINDEKKDGKRQLPTIQSGLKEVESQSHKIREASPVENAQVVKEQTKSAGKNIVTTFRDWLIGPTIQEAISQITGIPRKMPSETSSYNDTDTSPSFSSPRPPSPPSTSKYPPIGALGGKSAYKVPDDSMLVVPEEKK